MDTPPLTPKHSSFPTEDNGDIVTWEHIESTGAATSRKSAIDLLSEDFARLSINSHMDRESRPSVVHDEYIGTSVSSDDDPLRHPGAIPPTIKVTPPDGDDPSVFRRFDAGEQGGAVTQHDTRSGLYYYRCCDA